MEIKPRTLPEDRVTATAVFLRMGVDLNGLLHLSDHSKAWIALYTCAFYHAIPLEVVTSLTTECFIQSLRRFLARQGKTYVVYSGNGKNFDSTSRALSNIDWNSIRTIASTQNIQRKFKLTSAL